MLCLKARFLICHYYVYIYASVIFFALAIRNIILYVRSQYLLLNMDERQCTTKRTIYPLRVAYAALVCNSQVGNFH